MKHRYLDVFLRRTVLTRDRSDQNSFRKPIHRSVLEKQQYLLATQHEKKRRHEHFFTGKIALIDRIVARRNSYYLRII